MKKNLILGIGSEILSDEGIVLMLIDDLKSEFEEKTDFTTALTGSLDLINEINGYENLLILDTIISVNGEPGSVNDFDLDDYQPTMHLENFHDSSLPVTIALGRKLGYELPKKIHIITVEISDNKTISNQLSPQISLKYNAIYQEIMRLVGQHI